jgi:hypothetical protein
MMAESVLQTLYWASDEAYSSHKDAGQALTFTRMTAAQSHDGSNSTKSLLTVSDDGIGFAEAAGYARQRFTLDNCTVSATITKVRVSIAASDIEGSSIDTVVCPDINGTSRGTPATPLNTSGYTTYTFDFATDPADSAAWTAAKINGYKWGFYLYGHHDCGSFDGSTQVVVSEFKVEVYGDSSTNWTKSLDDSVSATDKAMYPRTVAASTMDMEAEMPLGTASPGTSTVHVTPMEMEATMVEVESADNVPGSFDPDVVTTLAVQADGAPQNITLRAHIPSTLGDQNYNTTERQTMTGPGSGDLRVTVDSFASESIEGTGDISGIIIHAIGGVQAGDSPMATVSLPEFELLGRGATMTNPPNTIYGDSAPYAELVSELLTTHDGTHAWTWENIYTGLTMLSAKVHVVYTGFTYVTFILAEVWVEVYGPVGTHLYPVNVSQSIGSVQLILAVPNTV